MFGEPKILFLYRRFNPSCAIDNGRFVNSNGEVFTFNYDNHQLYGINQIYEFCKILNTKTPSEEVSRQEILNAYKLMSSISNIKIKKSPYGFDAGQNTLYAICDDEFVELSVKGNEKGYINNETAQKIFDILKKNSFFDIKKD